jgi:hypothetical protein
MSSMRLADLIDLKLSQKTSSGVISLYYCSVKASERLNFIMAVGSIFGVPLRIVVCSKARMVLQGHIDPGTESNSA